MDILERSNESCSYPLVGLSVFEQTATQKPRKNHLHIRAKGLEASGYEDAKGFVVSKGSQAIKDELPSIHPYMATLRKDLLEQGVLQPDGDGLIFSQDHVFNSPSTAAGVILGRPTIALATLLRTPRIALMPCAEATWLAVLS